MLNFKWPKISFFLFLLTVISVSPLAHSSECDPGTPDYLKCDRALGSASRVFGNNLCVNQNALTGSQLSVIEQPGFEHFNRENLPSNFYRACLDGLFQRITPQIVASGGNDDDITRDIFIQNLELAGSISGFPNDGASAEEKLQYIQGPYLDHIRSLIRDILGDQGPEDGDVDSYCAETVFSINSDSAPSSFQALSRRVRGNFSNVETLCAYLQRVGLDGGILRREFTDQNDFTLQYNGNNDLSRTEFLGAYINITRDSKLKDRDTLPQGEYRDSFTRTPLRDGARANYLPTENLLIIDRGENVPAEDRYERIENVAPDALFYDEEAQVILTRESTTNNIHLANLENVSGDNPLIQELESNESGVPGVRVRFGDPEDPGNGGIRPNYADFRPDGDQVAVTIYRGEDGGAPVRFVISRRQYDTVSALIRGGLAADRDGQRLDLEYIDGKLKISNGRFHYQAPSNQMDNAEVMAQLRRLNGTAEEGYNDGVRFTRRMESIFPDTEFLRFPSNGSDTNLASALTQFRAFKNTLNLIDNPQSLFRKRGTSAETSQGDINLEWDRLPGNSILLSESEEDGEIEYLEFPRSTSDDQSRVCLNDSDRDRYCGNRPYNNRYEQANPDAATNTNFSEYRRNCFLRADYVHSNGPNNEIQRVPLLISNEFLDNFAYYIQEGDTPSTEDVMSWLSNVEIDFNEETRSVNGEVVSTRFTASNFKLNFPPGANGVPEAGENLGCIYIPSPDQEFGEGFTPSNSLGRSSRQRGDSSPPGLRRREWERDCQPLRLGSGDNRQEIEVFQNEVSGSSDCRLEDRAEFVLKVPDSNSRSGYTEYVVPSRALQAIRERGSRARLVPRGDFALDLEETVSGASRPDVYEIELASGYRLNEDGEAVIRDRSRRRESRFADRDDDRRESRGRRGRRTRRDTRDGYDPGSADRDRDYVGRDRSRRGRDSVGNLLADLRSETDLREAFRICSELITRYLADGDGLRLDSELPEFMNLQASMTMHKLGHALLNEIDRRGLANRRDLETKEDFERVILSLGQNLSDRRFDQLERMIENGSIWSRTEFAYAMELLMTELYDAQSDTPGREVVPEYAKINSSDINTLHVLAQLENQRGRRETLWLDNGRDESVVHMIKMLHTVYMDDNAHRSNDADLRLDNMRAAIDEIDSLERDYYDLIGRISSEECNEISACINNPDVMNMSADEEDESGSLLSFGDILARGITEGLRQARGDSSSSRTSGGRDFGRPDRERDSRGGRDRNMARDYLENVKFEDLWIRIQD